MTHDLEIGEVARRAGIAASAIRYYESIGLLPAPYRESGRRRYDEGILGRLAFIDISQQAGFTLREITDLVHAGVQHERLAEALQDLAARKLDEVRELIERAETMKGWLEVAGSCTCATPEECTLFPQAGADSRPAGLQVIQVGAGCRRERPGRP